jgi:pyridoxamine 5'-phosphate oxidase family protein
MSPFHEREVEYLRGQPIGRLATVSAGGAPHVVPVGFRVDPDAEAIEIGGHGMRASKKWRDLLSNSAVAFVVDDLASRDPWTPRGIEIRGHAELHETGGDRFGEGWDAAWLRIRPRRIVSWGIQAPPFSPGSRSARSVPDPASEPSAE